MDGEDDMFAAPEAVSGSESGANRSLYQVLSVGSSAISKATVKDDVDLMEDAAKRRFAKVDAANKSRAQQQHHGDSRRSELYDDKDKAEFEDDLENLIDIGAMGEDSAGRSKSRSNKNARDEYTEILEGERIEPLNMKGEMRRGEVNLYGEMKSRKRRNDAETDPSELALPPDGSKGSSGANSSERCQKAKRRRGKLSTGDSSDSESSDSGDDGANGEMSEDELEQLKEDDPWMAAVVKSGESAIYHSSSRKAPSSTKNHPYLKDTKTALTEMSNLLKEGPVDETVLKLVKRLTPNSNRAKKAKTKDDEAPSNSTDDNVAAEALQAKKDKFEMAVNIADFLLDSGLTKIYEMTYEDVVKKLDPKKAQKKDGEKQKLLEQGDEGFWQYKWSAEAEEVFGPFDTQSMKSWAASFAQYPTMVVRGFESPSQAQKCPAADLWAPFVPLLWS